MLVPISWLKDYIDIDLPLLDLAKALTMAGLEVEEIKLVGLPDPYAGSAPDAPREFKVSGLSWAADKFVVAQINEVLPHPNADRLVLCKLDDGTGELIVLTGAPNLYDYKGTGPLAKPIKVAYAREGAVLYDGHQPGLVLTTLKRAKIRGVDSFSMVCSEKELGISEEHEGIILLDDDAPAGMPLVEYMGDAVLEISMLPNMIRDAAMIGIARELSALTGKPLHLPKPALPAGGPSLKGKVSIQITDPALNQRFAVGMLAGAEPRPSPYWVQRRLRMAGMRPINSIVDATNYVMLELGEPLHAFDYDVLVQRANGAAPTIITRAAEPGEKLTTLDEVERTLEPFTILVTDTAGPLSLAGVMGGLESEVTDTTRNVLLEGASWNFINVRRTAFTQRLTSEAGYRFSRGIHPALASEGVLLGLQRMADWSGGTLYSDMVDEYPAPPQHPEVALNTHDVVRILGIELSAQEIAALLTRLEFTCRIDGDTVYAVTPPHRLDIGEGVIGKADLLEEVARIYGYERIPTRRLPDELPAPRTNTALEMEAQIRNLLARLGLQEVINYRMTNPEREARLDAAAGPQPERAYIHLKNPLSPERSVMRRSLLASILDLTEKNARISERLALFEIGPVFLPELGDVLPAEPQRLAIALTGLRTLPAWDLPAGAPLDFFDLKGIVAGLVESLHIEDVQYKPAAHPAFHPGKCAEVYAGESLLGVFGELHPQVKAQYDFLSPAVLAADFDLAALTAASTNHYNVSAIPVFPATLEDIAVIVDETVPAGDVEALIRQTGGKLLREVRLFDIFRSEQIGAGKKSLAYSLTYQAADHTLSAKEAEQIRHKIVKRLEFALGAKLRTA